MRAWSVAAVLVLSAMAGCLGSDDAEDLGAPTVEGGETTGFLRGVVMDETIRPLAGAVVTVTRNDTHIAVLTTGADGLFGIAGLAAGDYLVNVTKPGYLDRVVRAKVQAGDALPPLVQIVLLPVPVEAAFIWPIVWNGLIACGTTFQNWCAAINYVTGIHVFDDQSFRFMFDEFMEWQRTPDFMQVEFVWTANNELAKWAYAGFWASTWDEWEECLCTPNVLALEEGSEYILVQLPGEAMREHDVGFTKGIGVGVSAGSGVGLDPSQATKLTVMVNQPFEGFMHVFYGCVPEDDWRFTIHGEPTCDPNSLARAREAEA